MPDFTLTSTTPEQDPLVREDRLTRSEVRAEVLIAAALFAAVGALFVLDPNRASAQPALFALCVALLALSHGARIDLPYAWTSPVQLAIVPTLFLLPGWLVPVTMMTAIVIGRIPDVVRGRTSAVRLLLSPGNTWFTVGPAAVLAAAGSPAPQAVPVLILVAMLAAQIGGDFVMSSIFHLLTGRASLHEQLAESLLVY